MVDEFSMEQGNQIEQVSIENNPTNCIRPETSEPLQMHVIIYLLNGNKYITVLAANELGKLVDPRVMVPSNVGYLVPLDYLNKL